VIAVPEIIVHPRHEQDEYLLLACDGVWDVMSNEDIAKFIYAYEQKQARVGPSHAIL
jgi:serine/threonine protein phosphatase PrpC